MSNTAIGLPTGKNIRINNPDRIQGEKSSEPVYSREVFPKKRFIPGKRFVRSPENQTGQE